MPERDQALRAVFRPPCAVDNRQVRKTKIKCSTVCPRIVTDILPEGRKTLKKNMRLPFLRALAVEIYSALTIRDKIRWKKKARVSGDGISGVQSSSLRSAIVRKREREGKREARGRERERIRIWTRQTREWRRRCNYSRIFRVIATRADVYTHARTHAHTKCEFPRNSRGNGACTWLRKYLYSLWPRYRTGDWCIATSSLHLGSCDRLLEREK